MLVKPLAGSVDDGFAAVGGLDAELKRLKDGACPVRDEFNSNLAGDSAKGFSHGDWAKRPVGLAKGHNGRSAHKKLTASVMRRKRRSEEAGRRASRMWEGRRIERPAPEVEGNECTALRL